MRVQNAGMQSDIEPRLRAGIVGPLRSRQGLGPFFKRFLEAEGVDCTAFVARTAEGREKALSEWKSADGPEVHGYLDTSEMLEEEATRGRALDILVIASPTGTHAGPLMAALEHPVHVLCEKPFLSGARGSAERAVEILRSLQKAGKQLEVHVQWPKTLPFYFELFPDRAKEEPRRLDMLLSPIHEGRALISDTLPHILSLCRAVTATQTHQ